MKYFFVGFGLVEMGFGGFLTFEGHIDLATLCVATAAAAFALAGALR